MSRMKRKMPVFNFLADMGEKIMSHFDLSSPNKANSASFEAGNIGFNLVYRELDQDCGVAIQIFSDTDDGEEVGLLSLDGFEKNPFLRIGENPPTPVILDVAKDRDGLDWTLNQCKPGKLEDWINEAGYPEIASELDQDAIRSVLPKLEKKARSLVAKNNKPIST